MPTTRDKAFLSINPKSADDFWLHAVFGLSILLFFFFGTLDLTRLSFLSYLPICVRTSVDNELESAKKEQTQTAQTMHQRLTNVITTAIPVVALSPSGSR